MRKALTKRTAGKGKKAVPHADSLPAQPDAGGQGEEATPEVVCIDFETESIEERPDYPPRPVGVAIRRPRRASRYYAWGHPTGNNCTKEFAAEVLDAIWRSGKALLFQNAKFDIDVAEVHFGMPRLPWQRYHDTMFLLFLDDPHQKTLSLKPSAERLLGLLPEERDAVADWLVANHRTPDGKKLSRAPKSENYWAGFIAYAPGDLVGTYAVGDVDRTVGLFELLHPRIVKRGMLGAYARERKLLPILLDMERRGAPINLKRLEEDVRNYGGWLLILEAWIRDTLQNPELNINSGAELVAALEKTGKIDMARLPLTATGAPSHSKEGLEGAVTDPTMLAALKYRTQLVTCLTKFMVPWLNQAQKSGGRIFTNWNQVKASEYGGTTGAGTGRFSSRPNMQNIPKAFAPIWAHDDGGFELPPCPLSVHLPSLPLVRKYVVPEKGHVLIGRDYSQQEPRILAHFEDGELLKAYRADPWLPIYEHVLEQVNAITGREFTVKQVKQAVLGTLYGIGVGLLAEKLGVTVEDATTIKRACLAALPGVAAINSDMKIRARSKQPIRTWGGREYYCEPPRFGNGKMMTFEYKMLNTMIQGSAADCTKEAIVRLIERRPSEEFELLLSVHDELLAMVPANRLEEGQAWLQGAMESIEFDVPMLSEGYWSATNWADLKKYDEKGKRVA